LIGTVPDILSRIVASKRQDLAQAPLDRASLESEAERMRVSRRDFRRALAARPAIIAEIKRASPSRGVLAEDFDVPARAARYECGGAAALSVLTDEKFFGGSLEDLVRARHAVTVPVLRKDFTVDPIHVVEAAAHGADAILLIAAILSETELREWRELAAGFGMASLVEVHNRQELEAAAASGAEIIGVNNRNLATFEVSIETSLELAPHLPPGALKVSESGIHSAADVRRLREAGFTAFLVGESLMRSADPARAIRELAGAA
jgi:indole-3-glycerol phosphate synthase